MRVKRQFSARHNIWKFILLSWWSDTWLVSFSAWRWGISCRELGSESYVLVYQYTHCSTLTKVLASEDSESSREYIRISVEKFEEFMFIAGPKIQEDSAWFREAMFSETWNGTARDLARGDSVSCQQHVYGTVFQSTKCLVFCQMCCWQSYVGHS